MIQKRDVEGGSRGVGGCWGSEACVVSLWEGGELWGSDFFASRLVTICSCVGGTFVLGVSFSFLISTYYHQYGINDQVFCYLVILSDMGLAKVLRGQTNKIQNLFPP